LSARTAKVSHERHFAPATPAKNALRVASGHRRRLPRPSGHLRAVACNRYDDTVRPQLHAHRGRSCAARESQRAGSTQDLGGAPTPREAPCGRQLAPSSPSPTSLRAVAPFTAIAHQPAPDLPMQSLVCRAFDELAPQLPNPWPSRSDDEAVDLLLERGRTGLRRRPDPSRQASQPTRSTPTKPSLLLSLPVSSTSFPRAPCGTSPRQRMTS
jgi:hypothetical protein